MTKIKNYIKSEWEATDIGEPNKIVGIEITINENSVGISQQKYIENILRTYDRHQPSGNSTRP